MIRRKRKRHTRKTRGVGAFRTGVATARKLAAESSDESNWKVRVNAEWARWWQRFGRRRKSYAAAMRLFLQGLARGQGTKRPDLILWPTEKSVAAIVSAMNEENSVAGVLTELNRLPLAETIVIINGSSDGTFDAARKFPAVTVAHYSDPLGYDVGRAIGAKLAKADILLFLDGDFIVSAHQLVPFVRALSRGADVALNNISPFIGTFADRDVVTRTKEFLNRSLMRPDLGPNSLTAVPHAISRRAIETIGAANLAVPPKALAMMLFKGLRVCAPCSVDVLRRNKHRELNVGSGNPVSELIVGDHLEALSWAFKSRGIRLGFPDMLRKRSAVSGE